MAPCDIRDIHAWFGRYTRRYLGLNKKDFYPVSLKIIHCQRVRREAVMLGGALRLDRGDLCITEAAALLHDIGRFEQFSRFKTFADSVSVNHAELGAELLAENDVLKKFSPSEAHRIIRAVQYHNRASLPENEEEDVLLLSKIIRDADKLDIWRVFIAHNKLSKKEQHNAVDQNLPDTASFSENALADVLAKKIVDYRNVSSRNDFALMRLGWVYDINFPYTCREILKRDYLHYLKLSLPQDKRIKAALEAAHVHLRNKAA